jgi:RimJ/RimL family protein N-acetyltransferase
MRDLWPLFGLRLTTPRLELRAADDDDLAELAELARDGVHDPGEMPFTVPWTDVSPDARARSVLQHGWRLRATWAPESWALGLVVREDGVAVGLQDVGARQFGVLREVQTGSWLGLAHHGRGIGTEMRAAALHLAFVGLGAEVAWSGAHEDNAASLRVSAKLGYEPCGTERTVVRGRPMTGHRLRLTRERWQEQAVPEVRIEGLEPALPMFGLDVTP